MVLGRRTENIWNNLLGKYEKIQKKRIKNCAVGDAACI